VTRDERSSWFVEPLDDPSEIVSSWTTTDTVLAGTTHVAGGIVLDPVPPFLLQGRYGRALGHELHLTDLPQRPDTALPVDAPWGGGAGAVPEAVLLSDGYLVEPEPAGGAGRVARVRQDHLEEVRTEAIG